LIEKITRHFELLYYFHNVVDKILFWQDVCGIGGHMTQEPHAALNSADLILNPDGTSSVVLVCEHASNYIPTEFHALGLPEADQKSHAAWDPGALAVTTYLSQHLNAVAVAGGVSRLVYDCNRPPSAPDAMPMRSEIIDVPGNLNLTQQDRDARTQAF
jgi:predicted N-formylglutamate amidohydrolase